LGAGEDESGRYPGERRKGKARDLGPALDCVKESCIGGENQEHSPAVGEQDPKLFSKNAETKLELYYAPIAKNHTARQAPGQVRVCTEWGLQGAEHVRRELSRGDLLSGLDGQTRRVAGGVACREHRNHMTSRERAGMVIREFRKENGWVEEKPSKI